METVIAEYHNLADAERAVRALEQRGVSIQNVSIVDESQRIWRKSHPIWAARSRPQTARRVFVVAALVSFIFAQLGLTAYWALSGRPVGAVGTWLVFCISCLAGGSLAALLSVRHDRKRARVGTGFSVILRADANEVLTVTRLLREATSHAEPPLTLSHATR